MRRSLYGEADPMVLPLVFSFGDHVMAQKGIFSTLGLEGFPTGMEARVGTRPELFMKPKDGFRVPKESQDFLLLQRRRAFTNQPFAEVRQRCSGLCAVAGR